MKKYWFKAKNYGWGWYPATWQGWLMLGIYLILFVKLITNIDTHTLPPNDTIVRVLPAIYILTILLLIICALTGEKPEWRWGPPKKTKKNQK